MTMIIIYNVENQCVMIITPEYQLSILYFGQLLSEQFYGLVQFELKINKIQVQASENGYKYLLFSQNNSSPKPIYSQL